MVDELCGWIEGGKIFASAGKDSSTASGVTVYQGANAILGMWKRVMGTGGSTRGPEGNHIVYNCKEMRALLNAMGVTDVAAIPRRTLGRIVQQMSESDSIHSEDVRNIVKEQLDVDRAKKRSTPQGGRMFPELDGAEHEEKKKGIQLYRGVGKALHGVLHWAKKDREMGHTTDTLDHPVWYSCTSLQKFLVRNGVLEEDAADALSVSTMNDIVKKMFEADYTASLTLDRLRELIQPYKATAVFPDVERQKDASEHTVILVGDGPGAFANAEAITLIINTINSTIYPNDPASHLRLSRDGDDRITLHYENGQQYTLKSTKEQDNVPLFVLYKMARAIKKAYVTELGSRTPEDIGRFLGHIKTLPLLTFSEVMPREVQDVIRSISSDIRTYAEKRHI